jgi:DNA-binding transcriptional LysR family regulator
MHWLAPRLASFAAMHPDVKVNLATRLRPFDFATTSFDAAIHYGQRDWPDADHLPLIEERLIAVGAQGLLKVLPQSIDDVLSYPLLQLDSRTGDWRRWFAHHGQANIRPPAMLFDQFSTMIQGAIHGLGLALVPRFLIERELEEGRLIPVYGQPIKSFGSYFLVWPKDQPQRAPLGVFITWLRGELSKDPLHFPPTEP